MGTINAFDAEGRRVLKGSKVRAVRYVARWRTPDHKSREAWFDRRIDAEAHLVTVEGSKLEGAYVDQSAGRVKFKPFAEGWAARQPYRASTAEAVAMILSRHVLPTFGHRPIAQITTSEVQAWVTGLSKGLAPSTVKNVYQTLTAILRAAVDDRIIVRTPCVRGVKLPRPDGGEITPMTPVEVRSIVDAVPARYTALVVLLAGTGLRPGEALGLCSSRVDWLRRQIRVDQQLVTIAGHSPLLAPPKTPSSVRTIPVPKSVLDVLAHHVEEFGLETDELLFHDEGGHSIRRSALGRMWRRAAQTAGVSGRTPHDLRHYAASVLIDRGANVKAVQRHLGHASATITLDTYSHLWPDVEDTTRAALEAGLQGVVNDSEAVVGVAR